MPLRAVIFDGFNTLFDGAPTLAAAIDEAVAAAHARLVSEGHAVPADRFRAAYARARDWQKEARRSSNREFPIEARLEDALRELGVGAADVEGLAARVAEAHMAGFSNWRLVHPEAPEVLAALHRRYRLGIASNYYDAAHLHRILDAVGIREHFDAVVSSAEVGFVKPDPTMFHEVLRRLGVRPEEALMVGDTPEHDVLAAQAIGMRGCYLPDPREKAKACPEADIVVTRLTELPAALTRFDP